MAELFKINKAVFNLLSIFVSKLNFANFSKYLENYFVIILAVRETPVALLGTRDFPNRCEKSELTQKKKLSVLS